MAIESHQNQPLIIGEGFLPYQFSVQLDCQSRVQFDESVETCKSIKKLLRDRSKKHTLPELEELIASMPHVEEVCREGAYSSIAIPLIMCSAMADIRSQLHAVVGTGHISEAIRISLAERQIELIPTIIADADSPLELSLRDGHGNHKTIRLYPGSRAKYRQRWQVPESVESQAAGLIVTRFNQGRAQAFKTMAEMERITSLRIAEPTRYVSLSDYLALLPYASQVLVSHRDQVLRKLAKFFDLSWESRTGGINLDSTIRQITDQLFSRIGRKQSTLIFVLKNEVIFARSSSDIHRFRPPERFDNRSRAARIQGAACACLGFPSLKNADDGDFATLCNRVVQAAYHGTETRPNTYPNRQFTTHETWQL